MSGASRQSPIKHLIKIFKNRHPVNVVTLHDGTFYLYNATTLLRSFRYYGGVRIYDMRINVKRYIENPIHDKIILQENVFKGSLELKRILDERYPYAKAFNPNMRHAFEFSFIENALRDTGTGFEVKEVSEGIYDIVMVHVEGYVSSSMRWYVEKGEIGRIFLRYRKKGKDVRIKSRIKIPDSVKFLFEDLLDAYRDGTLSGIE